MLPPISDQFVAITPATPLCADPRSSAQGLPAAGMGGPLLQDYSAAKRDPTLAVGPLPPAPRRSDPTEHRQSPPAATPKPNSAARGLPSAPRMRPRRNDRQ